MQAVVLCVPLHLGEFVVHVITTWERMIPTISLLECSRFFMVQRMDVVLRRVEYEIGQFTRWLRQWIVVLQWIVMWLMHWKAISLYACCTTSGGSLMRVRVKMLVPVKLSVRMRIRLRNRVQMGDRLVISTHSLPHSMLLVC